jgi:ureidoglycolate lyase
MSHFQVPIRPLTREAFQYYGDVVQVAGSPHHTINQGWAERYSDLARLDVSEQGGRFSLGIVRAEPRPLPLRIKLMERHPMSSQFFMPLAPRPFLVVVAPPGHAPKPEDVTAFRTVAGQGVNYHRGVWHHPLIALDQSTDFLVVDRRGEGENCDEVEFKTVEIWIGEQD